MSERDDRRAFAEALGMTVVPQSPGRRSRIEELMAPAPVYPTAPAETPKGNGADAYTRKDDPRPEPSNDEPVVRQLDYVMAEVIEDDADAIFDDELVEGVIGRGRLAVIYGESNSGKTFCALDLGASIGREVRWLGRNCIGGLVVYLASEAPGSVELRLRAYQRHHGIKVPRLAIVRSPIDLYDGEADALAVLALITRLEQQSGEKCVLVIGDTLSRLSAGANENSGEDMGKVLRHIDVIRHATGAAFLLIHHTGKDAARGMRGWSGLRAAVDTEIEVTSDEASGTHTAEVTKQRDLQGKGVRIGFRLEVVNLGRNRWGGPRGSCVVQSVDAPPKAEKVRGTRQSEIDGAIIEVLTARGAGMKKAALVSHFDGRKTSNAVYKRISAMREAGRLNDVAGVVSLRVTTGGASV